MNISVVDYGLGNLGSIVNMLSKVGVIGRIVSTAEEILSSSKLILPGVGAFDSGMRHIDDAGIRQALTRRVIEDGIPILGICLGMQLLGVSSSEGQLPGLGWLPVGFQRFEAGADRTLRVPHMGWNTVKVKEPIPLLEGLNGDSRFYFVHSFHAITDTSECVLATSYHGGDFPSVIGRRNILGVQFHPEKSHKFGKQLLKNFAERY